MADQLNADLVELEETAPPLHDSPASPPSASPTPASHTGTTKGVQWRRNSLNLIPPVAAACTFVV